MLITMLMHPFYKRKIQYYEGVYDVVHRKHKEQTIHCLHILHLERDSAKMDTCTRKDY